MASTATAASSSLVDAHLEMDPGDAIEFTLTVQEATPRVTLTLRHPDPDSAPVAFKVIYTNTNSVFYVSNKTIERQREVQHSHTHECGFHAEQRCGNYDIYGCLTHFLRVLKRSHLLLATVCDYVLSLVAYNV
jgi:hypothetical protein